MSDQVVNEKVEALAEQAAQLPLLAQIRLVERIMGRMKDAVPSNEPLESLRGLWEGMGTAPSAEDIDEIRREMWKNFPREDI